MEKYDYTPLAPDFSLSRFCLRGAALLLGIGLLAGGAPSVFAGWSISDGDNPEELGRRVLVEHDGKKVASLIYGEGQMKPFLHVYGTEGERLTNPGINAEGDTVGRFPHHRGIFIGWNHLRSELGSYDLWHMSNGGAMDVLGFERLHVGPDSATIVARIAWRAGSEDDSGSNLLLTERRELVISRPNGDRTQIDANFTLEAARNVELDGDLQHAGIHYRAAAEVDDRRNETTYLWEPDLDAGPGRIISSDFKWNRLVFPIGDNWYSALQLNAPETPVEELSWRDYGRFGFFFARDLEAGETLELDYRFIVESVEAPASNADLSDDQTAALRERSDAYYRTYVGDLNGCGCPNH